MPLLCFNLNLGLVQISIFQFSSVLADTKFSDCSELRCFGMNNASHIKPLVPEPKAVVGLVDGNDCYNMGFVLP